jgi:hypothetical protein
MSCFIDYSAKMLLLWFLLSTGLFLSAQTSVPYALVLEEPAASDQDDMCIWIHPDPARSTIITSDKGSDKLIVYDLQGNTLQIISLPAKPRNIDVRYNFSLDGSSGVRLPGIPPGDYYIVICHRNHLSVMSSEVHSLGESGVLYDFTTAQQQAYGSGPLKELPGGIFGMIAGDANAE